MKSSLVIAAALATVMTALPAKAVTLTYTLGDVVFVDGGTATGTFTTDSTTGDLIDFDIDTTAGTALGGFHYDAITSMTLGSNVFSSNSFLIISADFSRYINFAFVDPLTTAGVDALRLSADSFECDNCTIERDVTGGFATAVAAAVPEPASWALLVVGFGLVGGFARRRGTAVAA